MNQAATDTTATDTNAPPKQGQPITHSGGRLTAPAHPIIPFIEGDGIGPDIWAASQRIFDAAVSKAYGQDRSIAWTEVLAGEKAFKRDRRVVA